MNNNAIKIFEKQLFSICKQELLLNDREFLFDYYNLIMANIHTHSNLLKDISENDYCNISYLKDISYGYTNGSFEIKINDFLSYFIILKSNEQDEKSYTIELISSSYEISESNTNIKKLQKIKNKTNNLLKELTISCTHKKICDLNKEKIKINKQIHELKNKIKNVKEVS